MANEDYVGRVVPIYGSKLTIANSKSNSIQIFVDAHFNWFQKKMFQICFGIKVEDATF